MRVLCGLRMGQSQRTLPRNPPRAPCRAKPRTRKHNAARALTTRRCAIAQHRTRASLRSAGAAPRNDLRISRTRSERSERSGRLDAHVMRLVDGAKPTHPTAHTRHARTAAQVHAPANTTPRARSRKPRAPQHSRTQFLFHVTTRRITARASAAGEPSEARRSLSAGCACWAAMIHLPTDLI